MKPYKPLKHFLSDDDSPLQRLVSHARTLGLLLDKVHRHLDPSLAEHCGSVSIHDQTLILYTTSSAWATRLRYHAPTLLESLHNEPEFANIRHIELKVKPHPRVHPLSPENTATEASSGPTPLSEQTIRLLEDVAAGTDDPGLKNALTRLAHRKSNPSRSS